MLQDIDQKRDSIVDGFGGRSREEILRIGFIADYNNPNTRKAYLRNLRIFKNFMTRFFKYTTDDRVDNIHIIAFKEFLKKSLSESSINQIMATLDAYYEYLIDRKSCKVNPVSRIKRFKVDKTVKSSDISNEDVSGILSSVDRSNGAGKMHYALLSIFFSTGMRCSEVVNLKIGDISKEKELYFISYKAKGGTMMRTPLNNLMRDSIGDYLEWRRELVGDIGSNEYLLKSTQIKRGESYGSLNARSVDYIFKKYAKRAGVQYKITPHSARVSVISRLLQKGIGINDVADFVGHKDIATTRSYAKRFRDGRESLVFDMDITQD